MIKILMLVVMSIGKFNPHLDVRILNSDNILSKQLMNVGNPNMNVDGSGAPVLFKAAPEPDEYWMVSRFVITLSDIGNFTGTNFATLSTLGNGVSVLTEDNEFVLWKDNGDISTSGRVMLVSNPPEITLVGHWPFIEYGGRPNNNGIRIDDTINGITFKIQDDLRTVNLFRARLEGMRFKKPIN